MPTPDFAPKGKSNENLNVFMWRTFCGSVWSSEVCVGVVSTFFFVRKKFEGGPAVLHVYKISSKSGNCCALSLSARVARVHS